MLIVIQGTIYDVGDVFQVFCLF